MVQYQHCMRSSLCLKIKITVVRTYVAIHVLNVSWITQKLGQLGHLMGQMVHIRKINYLVVIQIPNRSHGLYNMTACES